MSGVTSCDLCDYTCKTCSSASSSACTDCIDGRTLSSGSCSTINATYKVLENWATGGPLDEMTGTWSPDMEFSWNPAPADEPQPWSAADTNCPSTSYVFGYYGYQTVDNGGTL